MGKKIKEKNIQREVKIEKSPLVNPDSSEMKWKIVLFVLGFLLYSNTINFDYALDDKIVITSNQITKKGWAKMFDHFRYDSMDGFWAEQYGISVEELNKDALVAGGRYRPLSLVTYSIEWGIMGANPSFSHFVNALLYALTGVILFLFLSKLFPRGNVPIWKSVAFWATLLFLSHPLHTEVVANIKSRDEILSFLFGILALSYLVDYAKSSEVKSALYSSGFLFLSLLSKETTIAFVALGPLMLYFFKIGEKKMWTQGFFVMLIPGIVYTAIRFMVIGSVEDASGSELMNDPFLNATQGEQLATIFLILAAYVKLLFLPFPLTHDYYPYHLPFLEDAQQYATWSDAGAIIGIVLLLGLLFVSLKGLKSRSLYSFLALFFLGTSILISNLFFPIGVFMNERFMYIPSLAWAIFISYVVLVEIPKSQPNKPFVFGILGVVVVVFSGMTFARNPAWHNDYTLAITDVKLSTGSAKANMSAGDALIRQIEDMEGQEKIDAINEAFSYLKKSLEIYPDYFPPLDLLGKLYFESGNYSESIKFYGYCADRKPGNPQFIENIFFVGNKLAMESRFDEAVRAFDIALAYSPREKRYLLAAAEVLAKNQQNPGRALPYMERAFEYYPNDPDVAEKMAITYAMLGRFQEAIQILEPLLEANPNNTSVMKNLGIAYYQMGETEKGMALVNKSQNLEGVTGGTP